MNPSDKITEYINHLPEWQSSNLSLFRNIVHELLPEYKEEWKWNVPVFYSANTMVFAMSAFKAHTKYNFIFNGALLNDAYKLFNNGFDSKKSRGIDLKEGEVLNEEQLRSLISESIHAL